MHLLFAAVESEQPIRKVYSATPFCRIVKPEAMEYNGQGNTGKEEQDLSKEPSLPFIIPIPAEFWNYYGQVTVVCLL